MSTPAARRRPGAGWVAPLASLAIVLALLGAWELYAGLGGLDAFLLPAPHDVVTALVEDSGLLWSELVVTAEEVALGILLALLSGLALVSVLHLFSAVRRPVYPLLIGSQTVPVPVFAPLLVAWLGYDLRPKVVIVAVICFFPIVVSTLDALRGVEPEQVKLVRTLGASRWQTFWHLEVPSALPGLLSGTRIAVVVAVIGAVFAEYAGSADGLGHLIQQATAQLQTPRAWAAVVMLSALAFVLFAGLGVVQRHFTPWATAREERHR